ncbi:MAG: hypothetical protein KAH44_19980 [Oricola sp.]|nr:hypothetical protein [Oricola sp.]
MAATLYPLATVAKILNLSERRVQQLVKEDILPKPEKGKYDLIACVRAYIKYLQERAFGKDAAPQDTHLERARLLKAQADKTELEVDTLRGNLMPVETIEADWLAMVMACRSRLLSIPSKTAFQIATLSDAHEIERFLKRVIYEALTELASMDDDAFESLPEDTEDGDLGLDAAAGADGESVG